MSNYKILQLGNPLLRLTSESIKDDEYGTTALNDLSELLFNVMKLENGLGLAAPQIGVNKRAIVFGMDEHPVHPEYEAIPYTVLFNPSFENITDETSEDYEGCLSVGLLRGKVSRYKKIFYRGCDVEGKLIEREVFNLHARVVQHEYDHLNGIIFLDKIQDYNSLGFQEELIAAGVFKSKPAD